MSKVGAAVVLALAVGTATVAAASTPGSPQRITCPVGGQVFTYTGYASYSRWGSLPDGQPTGSVAYPIAMPQRPTNGLPLFDDFDADTVRRLTPLVTSPAFVALRRAGETQRYLAQWLMMRLDRPALDRTWVLLNASWEAKNAGDAARVRRYNDEYVTAAGALTGEGLDVHGLKARRVNALRELGRFEEAEAARAALLSAPTRGDEEERREWDGWRTYLTALAPVIARRDDTRTPIDLMGTRDQTFRCIDEASDLSEFDRSFCATPAMKTKVEELRKLRGKLSS